MVGVFVGIMDESEWWGGILRLVEIGGGESVDFDEGAVTGGFGSEDCMQGVDIGLRDG